MTNFEKIKAMDIDELAEFLQDEICYECFNCTIANFKYHSNDDEHSCIDIIKNWLKREEE